MDNKEQTTSPLTGSSAKKTVARGPPKWRSMRFVVAYMILWGNVVIFLQRMSFSMIIICMVNHTALDILYLDSKGINTSVVFNHSAQVHPYSTKRVSEAEYEAVEMEYKKTAGTGSTNATDLVDMSNYRKDTVEKKDDSCRRFHLNGGNVKDSEDGPFVWTKETQGLLLGAVYWGYMATQIFSGYLFYMFGPRRVCVVSVLAMSLLIILCHPAAHWSPWAVFALRVAVGIFTSFAMPSLLAMWGKWAPQEERATLLCLSFSGQSVANSAVFPITALLCKYGFKGGWPSAFYVYGVHGVIWSVVWMVVVSDGPESSRWISSDEKAYIMASRGQVSTAGKKVSVPWCKIFTSSCFWAIAVAHVTFTWGLFLFCSNLPLYMYEVMNFDIKSNGMYSMLPYIALGSIQILAGFITDFIVRRGIMSVFLARRFVTLLAGVVPAVCLVIMSYLDCTNVVAVMSLLVVSVGFMGFAFAGFLVNPFDIAPRYAVSITSVTNSLACLPGILTPYVVAEVTTDKTREQWQIIFFITGAVYACGTTFFCVFAKTSAQPWAVDPSSEKVEVELLEPVGHPPGNVGKFSGAVGQQDSENVCEHLDTVGKHTEDVAKYPQVVGEHLENVRKRVENSREQPENGAVQDNVRKRLENEAEHTGKHADNVGAHLEPVGKGKGSVGEYPDSVGKR